MNRILAVLAVCGGMLLTAIPITAHHSFEAEYDRTQKVTLKGKVTKVEWQNPHVYYYVDVADPKRERGELGHRSWRAEWSVPGGLAQGFAENRRPGDGGGIPRESRRASHQRQLGGPARRQEGVQRSKRRWTRQELRCATKPFRMIRRSAPSGWHPDLPRRRSPAVKTPAAATPPDLTGLVGWRARWKYPGRSRKYMKAQGSRFPSRRSEPSATRTSTWRKTRTGIACRPARRGRLPDHRRS